MYFVYLITLLILFFHLLNWIQGKTTLFTKNKLLLPLLIFFSSQLLSSFFSVDPHTSIFGYYSRLNGGLLSLTSYTILFLVLSQYNFQNFINKIINFSLASGLLVSSFGILEHFGIDKHLWVQDVQSRVFSTFGQPNWLAAYLCILLPFAVNKFFTSKTFTHKIFSLLIISNFYLCLLFTKSKSGLAAGAISITIFLAIYIIKNLKSFEKRNFAKVAILAVVFLFLSLSINNPIKNYLIFTLPKSTDVGGPPPIPQTNTINITPSEDIRKIVWQGSIDLWKRFPLFGTGPETFAFSYYWTRPASHNLTSEWDFLYNKAHNEYLNYLATTGTLGFLAYIFFITSVIYFLIKNIFLSQINNTNNNFYLAILSSFISILITNFVGFSVVVTSLFFFLLSALIYSEPINKTINKPKNKLLYFPIITLFIYLLIKTISFIIADIAYNQSQNSQTRQLYSQAQNFINLALSIRPDEAIYQSQSAAIAAKLNQPELAVSHSNLAISLSPASTNLWKERAQLFSELALIDPKYFSYAIDALEKCARLAPTDAKTFYLLGKFYEAAGEIELATKNYQQALALKSNYDYASFSLGEIYFNDKNYPEAKKYFETTLIYAPTNPDAQKFLDKIGKLLIK